MWTGAMNKHLPSQQEGHSFLGGRTVSLRSAPMPCWAVFRHDAKLAVKQEAFPLGIFSMCLSTTFAHYRYPTSAVLRPSFPR